MTRDYQPDLGHAIGSKRWLRDLGVLALLLALPFAMLTGLRALAPERGIVLIGGATARSVDGAPIAKPSPAPAPRAAPIPTAIAAYAGTGSLAAELQAAGIARNDARRAEALVASAIFPDTVQPGTRLLIDPGPARSGGARSLMGLRLRATLDAELTVTRRVDGLAVARRAIAIDATPLRIGGAITGDLAQSARGAGAPESAVAQFVAALRDALPGYVAQAGDRFDIVVDHRRAADGAAQAGDVIFASIARGANPLAELVRWGRDAPLQAIGRGDDGRGRAWPVNGRFTSRYGMRFHPVLQYARWHSGIDIGAPAGTPIYSVSDGVVAFAGRRGGYGNYVRIEHAGGLATGYAHLSRIAVAPGTPLRAGQLLGTVGSTGLSTGPHLHYEVYRGARSLDPASAQGLLASAGGRAPDGKLDAGIAALRALLPSIPAAARGGPPAIRSR